MTDVAASVKVTPPTSAPIGGWVKYELTVCSTGGCSATPAECIRSPDPTTTCHLTGLLPDTAYTIKVDAVAGSIHSLTGSDTLTTRIS